MNIDSEILDWLSAVLSFWILKVPAFTRFLLQRIAAAAYFGGEKKYVKHHHRKSGFLS